MNIELIRESITYNPETGIFTWKRNTKRRRCGEAAGCRDVKHHPTYDEVYIAIRVNDVKYRAHRLAFAFMGRTIPKCVDHINGDTTDNRWENLRAASFSQNSKNKRRMRTNKSGYTGVYFDKHSGKWRSYISVNRKQVRLGTFSTAEAAYRARVVKLEELGGCDYSKRHGS